MHHNTLRLGWNLHLPSVLNQISSFLSWQNPIETGSSAHSKTVLPDILFFSIRMLIGLLFIYRFSESDSYSTSQNFRHAYSLLWMSKCPNFVHWLHSKCWCRVYTTSFYIVLKQSLVPATAWFITCLAAFSACQAVVPTKSCSMCQHAK